MKTFKRSFSCATILILTICTSSLIYSQEYEACFGKTLTEIRVRGARFTKIEIITRELASRVGQVYIRENAAKDYARLDKLDIFSEVILTPKLENGSVVLEIAAQEIYPYLPFITYEVTDENGLSIGAGVQSVNMLGRDIFLTGLARFGGATSVTLFLSEPWFSGNHLSYVLEVNRRERENLLDDFLETSTEISLRLGSYIGETGRIGALLGFQSIESDTVGRTLTNDNKDIVGRIGFFIGYDTRDLWSNPHTGWLNQFDVSKVGGFLGFDSDLWQFNFDVRRYVPVMKRHTLALFSLLTLTAGDKIASWQDFHLGGTNSVRGWDLDSRSGKQQFINTAEYRYTFIQPRMLTLPLGLTIDLGLQLALFGDWAVAWDKKDEFKVDNSIAGYGAGIRLLVPFVSQFRFDFAAGESGMGVFVRIGSFAKPEAQRNRVR